MVEPKKDRPSALKSAKHYADEYGRFLLNSLGPRIINEITVAEWKKYENCLFSLKGKKGKEIAYSTAVELRAIAYRTFEFS